MPLSLSSIHRFPVKSCRGEDLDAAVVEPWGLAGDRRWMVVDEDGAVITAREANGLVLIDPTITPDGLALTAPELPPLEVRTPDPGTQTGVTIWHSTLTAAPAGQEADAWFSKALGRTARLVHLDDPTRRPTSIEFSEPDDRVSFADGYPLLVATEASLAALNDVVLERSEGVHPPLPMTRFRPNVVIAGTEAWEEDDWRRIRIGDAVFRAVKGCARCVLTTIDPDTAARGKEPIASLARIRRWDGATWFGVNLVPDTPGVTIRVGDEVEILDRVAPGGGPIRPAG
ncbi:molybdenum cofactor biosysynthesis protein [Nocardioides sp. Root1257]|uniref:MOSC domain-containing protein n=1 Tax=unclassified Nocardioides TaxID=2615069 RepID=UPI0006F96987|nr:MULTISPECIES: MOSC N-terminal beta barrel domain-containing protein [unclassified Nocardioides]KQW46023.1 molybdenum cofactor biosysynthesis protein [Nocardioides sp. Root1257]KRC43286.1 molybdenum cofactor biosysynthesis protein [Nocardioides sp. Root224]